MRVEFNTARLRALYADEKDAHRYPAGVVEAFFEVMHLIAATPDEREFYKLKSLHYEKLKGSRQHERSMRLTSQWRLIAEIKSDDQGKYVLIKGIEDYH